MEPELGDALRRALGAEVRRASPLGGGDINDAYEVVLADGRRVFVKTNSQAPSGMFAPKPTRLEWLSEAGALRIPAVLAHGSGADGVPAFLVLEFLERARPRRGFDDELGHGLAALHRSSAESFGFREDNFIGRLPRSNRASPRWAEFLSHGAARAQLELAEKSGLASTKMRRGFERLFPRLDELLGPEEPPARCTGTSGAGTCTWDRRESRVSSTPPSTEATARSISE